MTRYILIGGEWKRADDRAAYVCSAIRSNLPRKAHIVLCLFANDEPSWQERYDYLTGIFGKHLPQATYELAQQNSFIQQMQHADAVYINDGDNIATEVAMKQYGTAALRRAFTDKLVVASSAGANALAVAYFTRTYGVIREGAGVLPIKLIAHYGSTPPDAKEVLDWPRITQQLLGYGDTSLPLRTVGEGKYIVLDPTGDPWGGAVGSIDV